MKKAYRKFTAEFKEQALALINLGKPVAEVARELEVGANLLYNWRQQSEVTQSGKATQSQTSGELSEAEALKVLRRENIRLQAENDILKKAAIILGTQLPNNFVR
jgi:transposase